MFRKNHEDKRLRSVSLFFLALAGWIIIRLFVLQIWNHEYYALFASNNHEIYQKLYPTRGSIFFQDSRTGEEYPAAVNKQFYIVYAVPREIDAKDAPAVAAKLSELLAIADPTKQEEIVQKLQKANDPYETIEKKVPEETMNRIKAENIPGIHFAPQEFRYYPERSLASSVLGFTAFSDQGAMVGKYGIEGYFNQQLTGKGGFAEGERGALGSWITLGERTITPAENGADIVLTIDRTLQFKACERLSQGLAVFKAASASLVMMNPKTGAILAMCSLPDFDPNTYSEVLDITVYNNSTIFTPYEVGSIFKPITMAAALDLELVRPDTLFSDPCERKINGRPIHNALDKCYGTVTMTKVLENSINTGMIWVQEQLGREHFREYIKKFGFGEKIGITLNTEAPGNIASLEKSQAIYGAVASFGQGFTATPLQMAAAYAAIANEGQMPRPTIVRELRFADGHRETNKPEIIEKALSPRAAKLLAGMLTSVVKNGQSYHSARLPGYYLAGKTGTAQIPGPGGYSEETNHTFAGFGPAEDPEFVLIVKYEKPERRWAESTAAPVFRDIMEFALKYYGIPENK